MRCLFEYGNKKTEIKREQREQNLHVPRKKKIDAESTRNNQRKIGKKLRGQNGTNIFKEGSQRIPPNWQILTKLILKISNLTKHRRFVIIKKLISPNFETVGKKTTEKNQF